MQRITGQKPYQSYPSNHPSISFSYDSWNNREEYVKEKRGAALPSKAIISPPGGRRIIDTRTYSPCQGGSKRVGHTHQLFSSVSHRSLNIVSFTTFLLFGTSRPQVWRRATNSPQHQIQHSAPPISSSQQGISQPSLHRVRWSLGKVVLEDWRMGDGFGSGQCSMALFMHFKWGDGRRGLVSSVGEEGERNGTCFW